MPTGRRGLDLSDQPIYCAHEHWGSIDSIGMAPEGFRADTEAGALPARRTGLLDILVDPYFHGSLMWAGTDLNEIANEYGVDSFHEFASREPVKAFESIRPAVVQHELTGTYQCIRRGILALHGIDIFSAGPTDIRKADASIARSYDRIHDWYRDAMGKARLSALVRPVHPEFYAREDSRESAAQELAFTGTVVRIDGLLDLWPEKCPRRNGLARIAGVEPRDAVTWREFVGRLFDLAAGKGALGIKQLQAYHRDLDFQPRQDSEVVFSGDLSHDQVRAFQDWVVHECCKQANDRGWPQQVHVGTHNITQSSPMPLDALAARYPSMKLVLIHCWPFFSEAGWLAKQRPNVYMDTCWLPVLNPEFYREALRAWLGYVPMHKLSCSQDSTSVEMAAGSAQFVREVLAESLAECSLRQHIGPNRLREIAASILHDNAASLYDVASGGDR